jgi:hypothetical protein
MSDDRISRRSLLKGALLSLAAVPASTLLAREASAAATLADPNEKGPKALGYIHDATKATNPAYKPGQKCANCMHYTAGKAGAPQGPCALLPGLEVKAAGWCNVWMLKPGAKLG